MRAIVIIRSVSMRPGLIPAIRIPSRANATEGRVKINIHPSGSFVCCRLPRIPG